MAASLKLEKTLREVARRYRLPALATASIQINEASPATTLAIAIEHARKAVNRNEAPDAALKRLFTEALAQLIQQAMREKLGDPAFQAMVLRQQASQVREYASLSAHADQDRRRVHTVVNAIAHPAKQQRMPPGPQRDMLAQLHAFASSASWSAISDTVRRLLAMPPIQSESPIEQGLAKLLNSPALSRLQHLDALASDELVQQYQSMWDRHGPRSGSPGAVRQGSASRRRGAAVEKSATNALQVLARRLNATQDTHESYRVVTSMRVPASIPANPERAKSEWDVVLLKQAKTVDTSQAWDISLLVEAKASVDAATTDLRRLLRGLRVLAHADRNVVYPFTTQQGVVRLRGASLSMLPTDEAGLARSVLYCCNAPAEATPRLLSAASRMQLLSAPASVAFASTLTQRQPAQAQDLEPVWHQLLESPRWKSVLHQYPTLCQVRELMVHTEDLLAAIQT